MYGCGTDTQRLPFPKYCRRKTRGDSTAPTESKNVCAAKPERHAILNLFHYVDVFLLGSGMFHFLGREASVELLHGVDILILYS